MSKVSEKFYGTANKYETIAKGSGAGADSDEAEVSRVVIAEHDHLARPQRGHTVQGDHAVDAARHPFEEWHHSRSIAMLLRAGFARLEGAGVLREYQLPLEVPQFLRSPEAARQIGEVAREPDRSRGATFSRSPKRAAPSSRP